MCWRRLRPVAITRCTGEDSHAGHAQDLPVPGTDGRLVFASCFCGPAHSVTGLPGRFPLARVVFLGLQRCTAKSGHLGMGRPRQDLRQAGLLWGGLPAGRGVRDIMPAPVQRSAGQAVAIVRGQCRELAAAVPAPDTRHGRVAAPQPDVLVSGAHAAPPFIWAPRHLHAACCRTAFVFRRKGRGNMPIVRSLPCC